MSTVVIRDDKRIARLKVTSQVLSIVGISVLVVSFILGWRNPERYFLVQLIGLAVGWIMSQVAIYLAHRYVRSPRMDEVLDSAVRAAAPRGRLYHYVLPASHVLLTEAGPIVLIPQFQQGDISVDEKGKWRQKGIGLRRWFGQEGLGNPSREAEVRVGALANFIRKQAPEVEEVPIAAAIVFTSDSLKGLNADQSPVPAVRHKDLKKLVRKNIKGRPNLPPEQYAALRRAFDAAADGIEPQEISK